MNKEKENTKMFRLSSIFLFIVIIISLLLCVSYSNLLSIRINSVVQNQKILNETIFHVNELVIGNQEELRKNNKQKPPKIR